MQILDLRARDFRNLETLSLLPHHKFNVIWGDNGQGKTNILEAIYMVCTLRSFRVSRGRDVIRIGQDAANIKATVDTAQGESVYELTQTERSRKVRLNGKAVRPLRNYFGNFNVVLFSPEDLWIPKGSPSGRRKFLDRAVFGANASHLEAVGDYEKILKNRNALLKKAKETGKLSKELLETYDQQLSEAAKLVLHNRVEFINKMKPRFEKRLDAISGQPLAGQLLYESSYLKPEQDFSECMASALIESRAADLARGTTSVGPHRDDLQFGLLGQQASVYASQGQLRAIVLAWKSAEMEQIHEALKVKPILLLDDVSSELDAAKNLHLFELLEKQAGQCFITTTDPEYVRISAEKASFRVINGSLYES